MSKRTSPPALKIPQDVKLPDIERRKLSNGIPLYNIRMGTQPVVRVDLVFGAGRWYESKQLVARACSMLLREGTKRYSAAQIAELSDYYGAAIKVRENFDHVTVSLICLTKYFDKLIPVLEDMLTDATFPEKDFADYVTRSKQKLRIELEKVDVLAFRHFTEMLFGAAHPYGYNSQPEMYDLLQLEDLRCHYRNFYTAENCSIFVAGQSDEHILALCEQHLGRNLQVSGAQLITQYTAEESIQRQMLVDMPNSHQSAIRVGRRMFTRNDPDYHGSFVLNTLLGGYFGSRIMMNLREDKGYTYGAYSALDTLVHEGYLYISTEVDREYRQEALDEIYIELQRLIDEPASEPELVMLRNYTLGQTLRALDGPFMVSELFRDIIVYGEDEQSFYQYVDVVKSISAEQLQSLAMRYLQRDDMFEVVVG